MSYKRKTCECCRKRLQGDESYWCDDCRAGITLAYDATAETARDLLQRIKDAAAQSPAGSKIEIRFVSENP